jgi:glycosyltransferase involved in cell wall biosynthesis
LVEKIKINRRLIVENKEEKTKILQVLGGLYCGGTETFVMNTYRAIDKEKFQFDFLVHEKEEAHYDKEILSLGGKIYRIDDRTEVGTLKYLINLFQIISKINPDVIHSHAMFNSGAIMLVSFLVGIKKRISHSHNTADQSEKSISRKIFCTIMRILLVLFSTDLLACSKDAGRFLFGSKIANSNKTHVLNNAIDVKKFRYNAMFREKIRNELNIQDKLVLGHVGRFNKQKNHELLIDIFKLVHEKDQNAVLVLIGTGPLKPMIEEKVRNLGLSSKVKFLGIRDDIANLMQGFDVFLLPSLFEGFPVVLTEAQGAGLPCIVADTITKDSDITGRMKFLDIKYSPEVWAQEILALSDFHVDTSEIIKTKGYDTSTNALWLGKFYLTKVGQGFSVV